MNVRELINRAESCHKETALEYYNALSGQKDELNFVAILKQYPELYSKDTYDYVMALGEGEVRDGRMRRFLREWITGNYFTERLKELGEELLNAEGNAAVEVDGQEYTYRAMPVMLGNEPSYERRAKLSRAYLDKMDELNPKRLEMDRIANEIVHELGYKDMIDLCQQVSDMKIYPLRDQLTQFLDASDDNYAEKLDYWKRSTEGIGERQMRHEDIAFLMRAGRFDDMFPPKDMVPALSRTMAGLGIDMDSQDNTTLDLEERPKKSPRAFCIGIDVPRDVRLVISPHGGADDYSTLFHEAGHLQFGAHMSSELSFVYRQYGDTSVHESYAFLLQHLVDNPVWWHEIMRRDPGEYPRFARFNRLYFLRRYSAKLRYEVRYYENGGGPEQADVYVEELSRSGAVQYPRERYLSDFDGGFYVLQYLQAWIWEVQLRRHLEREFGETWFTKKAAGDFLRELWHDGQKYDVWEIARKLGYDGLDTGPIQEELLA